MILINPESFMVCFSLRFFSSVKYIFMRGQAIKKLCFGFYFFSRWFNIKLLTSIQPSFWAKNASLGNVLLNTGLMKTYIRIYLSFLFSTFSDGLWKLWWKTFLSILFSVYKRFKNLVFVKGFKWFKKYCGFEGWIFDMELRFPTF